MDRSPKYSFLEAKQKIEAYCAYQERCDQEVRNKLHSWQLYAEDVDILIADLITNNFLNKERFAAAFASGKFRIKKWGRIKIRQHLKQKGISDYSINKGLSEIDPEEYIQTIQHIIENKLPSAKGKNDWEKKMTVQKYLYSRGFEMDLIQECFSANS